MEQQPGKSAPDVARAVAGGDLTFLDRTRLQEWMVRQRWFASKARELSAIAVLEALPLRTDPPLANAIIQARHSSGTHELYQAPLGFRLAADGPGDGAIERIEGWEVYDALADPAETIILAGLLAGEVSFQQGETRMVFHRAPDGAVPPYARSVRTLGAEQSNTSLVFDESLVMKIFRRLEPGANPELEMLSFLAAHDFQEIAPFIGWCEYASASLAATVAIVQGYIAGGRDGFEYALAALQADPASLREPLRALGQTLGRMHTVLASDPDDPDFAPEEPSEEAPALLAASIDEAIEQAFLDLPQRPELAPLAGRSEELRDRLAAIARMGVGGRVIRTHGDMHLGQTLLAPDGRWLLIDFEGEPARPLIERRRKRSPLRDVAGMLRSFAYVAAAAEIRHGVSVPAGWQSEARESFLAGYMETVEGALMPIGLGATERQLMVFELEKAIYELRYELEHRPDWVQIPVAAIVALLEEPAP